MRVPALLFISGGLAFYFCLFFSFLRFYCSVLYLCSSILWCFFLFWFLGLVFVSCQFFSFNVSRKLDVEISGPGNREFPVHRTRVSPYELQHVGFKSFMDVHGIPCSLNIPIHTHAYIYMHEQEDEEMLEFRMEAQEN